MGNLEPLSTATDRHGLGLCHPPRTKQNDAVVAELLSILWLEGTEICPKPAATNAPTEAESHAIEDWDRHNDKGLGMIQLSIKMTIRQSINRKETLTKNWKRLQETYSTCSGLNLWMDVTRYYGMMFNPKQPLTQQINEMSKLRSRIMAADMGSDNIHAMLILKALPSTYEVTQQTILANVKNYKELTSANIRAQILAEELHQTSATINAIRPGRKTNACNWCGGSGHWERDCRQRIRGLFKEEAQSEWKQIAANRKEEAEAAKKNTPSVSATIQEVQNNTTSSTSSRTSSPTSVTVCKCAMHLLSHHAPTGA